VPDEARPGAALVDARGLECPIPVFHARDAMFDLKAGEVLEVLADDPQAPTDLQSWARREGHAFLSVTAEGRAFRILVRRGPDPPDD
jgi:tRNA 2-thiouridine synthesizing protein A